jgi:hypothetical protein
VFDLIRLQASGGGLGAVQAAIGSQIMAMGRPPVPGAPALGAAGVPGAAIAGLPGIAPLFAKPAKRPRTQEDIDIDEEKRMYMDQLSKVR